MDSLFPLFNSNGFMPHGMCFLWRQDILYTHFAADAFTGLAYYSIAASFTYILIKRDDIPYKWFVIPFGILMFAACGTAHFFSIWTIWNPDFGTQAIIKAITGMVSVATAIILWYLIPQVIAWPSPSLLRKKNEELEHEVIQRRSAEQTLVESEQKFRNIVEGSLQGIFVHRNYKPLFANQVCADMFGYDNPEDIMALDSLLEAFWMPEERERAQDYSVRRMAGEDTPNTYEYQGMRKNGAPFWFEKHATLIDWEGEKSTQAAVIDINDRKQSEEKLQQTNAELEEFAYRTSHDLRSPLVSSISLLSMTEEFIRSNNDDRALESLAHAQESLRTLEKLITNILSLTRIKNEKENEEAIDIAVLINDSLDKFKYMDHFERLDIQRDLRFSDTLSAKKSRFTLIVENMISNVVKYQDLEKDKSFIKISTYREGNNFVLEVHDNGLGIPKNQQDNLFKMFRRFHPKISFGSGLGLYMMKKSADILGGQIYFEDPGDGSVFKLKLPLTK